MRARSLLPLVTSVCTLALALAACGSGTSSSSTGAGSTGTTSAAAATGTSSTQDATTPTATSATSGPTVGFEGVPLEQGPALASAGTTQTETVDGISCKPIEQLAYHIHAHLAVFDDSRLYALPAGVGIPGSQAEDTQYGPVAAGGHCYYWLHTHTSDGVIHIESPTKAIYTLGNFFDVWHQPLTPDRVASLHGTISVFVNGKAWHRSPRSIPLLPHEDIQLEIGKPIPPLVTIDWSKTQL